MAEINPSETNTYDLWAEFERAETSRTQKFDELHRTLVAHRMDTPFRPRELWATPTNVGWVRMVGYVKPVAGHGPVEHLIVNEEQGDSTDYAGRRVLVHDYWIDFERQELAEEVTEVSLETGRDSREVPRLNPDSGPVIDYHNLNCEVSCGVNYNEAMQHPRFGEGSSFQIDEIMQLLQNAPEPDAIDMYHESATPGNLR